MQKENRHLEPEMILELMVFMMLADREASSKMTRNESGMRQKAWILFTVLHGIGCHAMCKYMPAHAMWICAQLMSAHEAASVRLVKITAWID